jgi:hypothetical protein
MVPLWVAAGAEYLLGVACDGFADHFFRVDDDRIVLAVEELSESNEVLLAI